MLLTLSEQKAFVDFPHFHGFYNKLSGIMWPFHPTSFGTKPPCCVVVVLEAKSSWSISWPTCLPFSEGLILGCVPILHQHAFPQTNYGVAPTRTLLSLWTSSWLPFATSYTLSTPTGYLVHFSEGFQSAWYAAGFWHTVLSYQLDGRKDILPQNCLPLGKQDGSLDSPAVYFRDVARDAQAFPVCFTTYFKLFDCKLHMFDLYINKLFAQTASLVTTCSPASV